MVAISPRKGLSGTTLLAITVTLAGIGIAAGIATAPSDTLDAAIVRSGLPSILPAATPPVGINGRILLALAAGGLIVALGWVAPLLAVLRRRAPRPAAAPVAAASQDVPVIRKADAHPDAPPRRPIRAAADLGAPLPIALVEEVSSRGRPVAVPAAKVAAARLVGEPEGETVDMIPLTSKPAPAPVAKDKTVEQATAAVPIAHASPEPVAVEPVADDVAPAVSHDAPAPEAQAAVAPPPERDLPNDLDQPLSVFDPGALPESPLEPVHPLPSLVHPREPAPEPVPAVAETVPAARIEVFEITPLHRDPAQASVPSTDAQAEAQEETIADLLSRLERGTIRRRAPEAPVAPTVTSAPTLDETLQRLRRLAAG